MSDTGELRERLIALRDSSLATDSGGAFRLFDDERDTLAEAVNALSGERVTLIRNNITEADWQECPEGIEAHLRKTGSYDIATFLRLPDSERGE